MKYILISQLFLLNMFAHGVTEHHSHIFGTFHIVDFLLLLVGVVTGFYIFKYFFKGNN